MYRKLARLFRIRRKFTKVVGLLLMLFIVWILGNKFLFNDTEIEDNQDLHDLTPNIVFKIHREYHCNKMDLIIVVLSRNSDFLQREQMRNNLGRLMNLIKMTVKLVFMLDLTDTVEMQERINEEAHKFGDIIQDNFHDSDAIHAGKYLSILKWVSIYCSKAKHVLQIDDGTFANLVKIENYLVENIIKIDDTFYCNEITNNPVLRTGDSAVPKNTFPGKFYPPYCSGTAILASPQAYKKLYLSLENIPFSLINEVSLTSILRKKANLKIVNIARFCKLIPENTVNPSIDINQYLFVNTHKNTDNWTIWIDRMEKEYKLKKKSIR